MPHNCPICKRVALWRKGINPDVVTVFRQSVLVAGANQHFRGYAVLLLKRHVREPHQLPPRARRELFDELMRSGSAVWKAFRPWKLNYACYGNAVPHIHWHIIPRYRSDSRRKSPPWLIREFRSGKPAGEAERARIVAAIQRHL